MAPLSFKTLTREKNARVWSHILKMEPLPLKTLIRERMLGFEVSTVARRKKICVLIADVRIMKIIFSK
jgi:hypothetical protein